jgi:LPS-assembly protein
MTARRFAARRWLRALLLMLATLGPLTARAQMSAISGPRAPVSQNQPVTFTADQVEYDREHGLVTARGHVEAWQNDHVLRADTVTFDRNTGVMAAQGHVVLLEPDGQTLFADYAEMNQGMKDAVLKDMRAILAQNARLAANGARRYGGQINEMDKVVYSTCNLCKTDPSRPLEWQLKADKAVQDLEHKKIEYENAVLEMYGVPVAYFPYFWHVDPSVKRGSGLLIPTLGYTSHLGAFFGQPYYLVIDGQSDATFTPLITSRKGPQIGVDYRRRFNDGMLQVNTTLGYDDNDPQTSIYLKGAFDYNDTWRWGFNVRHVTSPNYANDFRLGPELGGNLNLLSSQVYLEGFGVGAYSRLDTRFYQAINTAIANSKLPFVLPRYQYSYFGVPDALGGRLSVDTGAFNVIRDDGTNTMRAHLTVNWQRPFVGALGDLWTLTLHGDTAAYNASKFNQQPNFATNDNIDYAWALPQAALDFRWPFMRDSGAWGVQLIEPRAQVIVAPRMGLSQLNRWPNEDSLDMEFSDANLFGFNRFPGIDRQEGGSRINVALHTAWYLNGTAFDSLIGQSYRNYKDPLFQPNSGLYDQVSDVVARATLSPTRWLDLTYRTRLDYRTFAARMIDTFATVGPPNLKLSGGYLYTVDNPYYYYDQPAPPPPGNAYYKPRNEVTFGAFGRWDPYRFSFNGEYNLQAAMFDTISADVAYEDECFIVDVRVYRRYTNYNGDHGSSGVLIQLTFKTVGSFGFKAL